MGLYWTAWGLPGTLSLLVAGAAAVVVLRTAPGRSVNRQLAVLLVLEGVVRASGTGLLFFFHSRSVVTGLALMCAAATGAIAFQYLSFLGVALSTPLVMPFRNRAGRFVLTGLACVAAVMPLLFPSRFVHVYRPSWAPWNFQWTGVGQQLNEVYGFAPLFGLVAALSTLSRTARGTAARSRAAWFAIAFGLRDSYYILLQLGYSALRPIPFWGDFLFNPGQGMVSVAFVTILAYGVLHTQMFDIDLKLKIALTHSLAGATIASAFFVGIEALESVFPVQGLVSGVILAAALVLALRPVEHLAGRVANRLMGHVEPTEEYLDTRRLQVYRAALEGAMEDGRITERERAILDRLKSELGISEAEARRSELELLV